MERAWDETALMPLSGGFKVWYYSGKRILLGVNRSLIVGGCGQPHHTLPPLVNVQQVASSALSMMVVPCLYAPTNTGCVSANKSLLRISRTVASSTVSPRLALAVRSPSSICWPI